uniref:Uncharacterized protein n=1 Tax=Oryza nivara TaxID=4536 RepID=A0A0E0FRC0_ORYNI
MEIKRVKIAVDDPRHRGNVCHLYTDILCQASVLQVLMCCTWGMAIAALSTALFARQHRFCISAFKCTRFLVGFVLAVSVGFLSAVKALGMLWILGSQFPRAE